MLLLAVLTLTQFKLVYDKPYIKHSSVVWDTLTLMNVIAPRLNICEIVWLTLHYQ